MSSWKTRWRRGCFARSARASSAAEVFDVAVHVPGDEELVGVFEADEPAGAAGLVAEREDGPADGLEAEVDAGHAVVPAGSKWLGGQRRFEPFGPPRNRRRRNSR